MQVNSEHYGDEAFDIDSHLKISNTIGPEMGRINMFNVSALMFAGFVGFYSGMFTNLEASFNWKKY